MQPARLAAVLATVAATAAAQDAVSVDYTGDCTVDVRDALEFIKAYSARSVDADLTGDGLVDAFDAAAFARAAANDPGPFAVHWCVTTQFGQTTANVGYRMDGSQGEDPAHPDLDKSRLDVTTDTIILYDHICGDYPYHGVADLFTRLGDPDLWEESYLDWRQTHADLIFQNVPAMLVSHDPPYTYGIIDYEDWLLRWVDMRANSGSQRLNQMCLDFVDVVDEINTPQWDPDFFDGTGYTIPVGTNSIAQLAEPEREDAYRYAWDAYARRLYQHTLNVLRVADDQAGDLKWSYWRTPMTHWSRPTRDGERQRNDELAWLYSETDVLSPQFYRRYYTTDDPNEQCPRGQEFIRSTQNQAEVWASAMQEVIRVRDLYNPDAEIIPVIWWHYQFLPEQDPFIFLNPRDAADSIRLARRWGADGVSLWGYLRPRPGNEDIAEPAPRQVVQSILNLRWRAIIDKAACN